MNNEETRILNPQQPEQKAEVKNNVEQPAAEKNPEQKPVDKSAAKSLGKRGAAFAAAAAGVVGAAAATGAQHLYNQNQEDAEEVEVEEVEPVETAPLPSHAPAHTLAANQEAPIAPEVVEAPTDEIPEDAVMSEPLDTNDSEEAGVTLASDSDDVQESDVHVLGVQVVDDGEGGQMFVAALEDSASGDQALVVDVDMDGTIDLLAVDENHNQQIDPEEIYDVHDQGWQSEGYIEAYAQEQPMVQQEEQNYMAAADENADYMNDADTGMFEA